MTLVLALKGMDEVVLAADSAGYTDHPGGMYRLKCRKLRIVNNGKWVIGIAGSDESLTHKKNAPVAEHAAHGQLPPATQARRPEAEDGGSQRLSAALSFRGLLFESRTIRSKLSEHQKKTTQVNSPLRRSHGRPSIM